ncbi:MAG: dolichyl-phosphate beta-glucosyltransferase [Bryobacteraceae bacterium]
MTMIEPVDITLILPAFNEAGRIRETITQSVDYLRGRGLSYQVIVAADGDDGTRELVREMANFDPRISVIGRTERSGKGRGVREAVALAKGAIIGYVDADNKVPIKEFDKISASLKAGYEVVIGSRAMTASKIEKRQPLYRQLGSRGFRVFLSTVVGLREIVDTQCGFKFFSHRAAKLIFSHQKIDGYMFDVEILVLANRLGLAIAQVPIRWRDDGDSRLELVSGNLRNLLDIFRIRFSSASVTFAQPAARGAHSK